MIKEYNNIEVEVNEEDLNKSNVIYKLTFPNDKIYIGQTIQKLKYRIRTHCTQIENNYKSNAIQKYKTFKVEILHQGEDLDNKEIKYISFYNSFNREFGYNRTKGGDGCIGYKHTEETKKKISELKKNTTSGCNNPKAKAIIVTDLFTGEEKEFNTIKDATIYYNVLQSTISRVILKKTKTFKKKQYTARYE